MTAQSLTLNPSRTARSRLQFYDGSGLTLSIVRNGVGGDLAFAIAPRRKGDRNPPDAKVQVLVVADVATLTTADLEPVNEGELNFFTLWNITAGTVVAEGQVIKAPAIKTTIIAPVSDGFFLTLDGLTLTAGSGGLTLTGETLETT